MFNFGTLIGRRRLLGDKEENGREEDKAIVHQTVPDGVLEPRGGSEGAPDMSWMDAIPVTASRETSAPEPEQRQPERPAASSQEIETDTDGISGPQAGLEQLSEQAANPTASARPRFPFAWLVVVEGAGVGEWFVLERGVTHIGSAEGQTVRLDFGDVSVAPTRHLALVYDEGCHAFVLDNDTVEPVRLNGAEAPLRATLRDGDVISLGGTSLRLATLCSPNFHWS